MKKSLISSHSAYHRPRDKLVTYYLSSFGRLYHYALRYAGSAAGRHHLETRHDKGRGSFCSCWYDHGAAEHLRRDYCSVFQHFSCAPRRSGLHCCESLHQACAD